LTNKHVIQELEKSSYSAILQWERYPIDKIRIDDTLDIAILKITVKNETIPLNIAKLDEQGEIWDIVFAIKNDAENWEFVTKMWIINSLNKKFEIQNNNSKYVWLIKNSTAIEWWFSGWPLINIKGEIVWLNTAIDNIEYSASYAIPLSQELISQTINTIKSNGKIIRPYLWIQYEESDFRAKITWIDEWSPASKTNLKVWDIIYWIDNHEVKYSTFLYTLYTYKIWKQITINTIENWHKKDTQLTIGQKE
jgi:S1-C subfamily serine protease